MLKRTVGSFYRLSGRVSYVILRPLLRRYLKGSRRSYVLLFDAGRVLLVRNWLGSDSWSLPGGGAHANESLHAAGAREVFEELRIVIEPSSIAQVRSGVWQSNGFEFEYVISSVETSGAIPKRRLFEITDAQFFSLDEALALSNIAPEIRRALATVQAAKQPD